MTEEYFAPYTIRTKSVWTFITEMCRGGGRKRWCTILKYFVSLPRVLFLVFPFGDGIFLLFFGPSVFSSSSYFFNVKKIAALFPLVFLNYFQLWRVAGDVFKTIPFFYFTKLTWSPILFSHDAFSKLSLPFYFSKSTVTVGLYGRPIQTHRRFVDQRYLA